MNIVATYITKQVIISGLLYLYYHVALRNKKFHSYNRFYLLAAMIISMVLPLVNFNWFSIHSAVNTPLANMLIVINHDPVRTPSAHISAQAIFFLFAALVSTVLFAIIVAKIVWIYNLKRRHKNTRMHGFTLVETNVKQAPFSFLSNLFWKSGVAFDDDNGKKILWHELAHITQKHTYDKLFAQMMVCIFWINPFSWLMQKELAVIHEFIADSGCIEEGDTESFALMLLQAHNGGRYLNPTNTFFHSSIKRRLIMIATSKRTPYSYARRVMAVPFAMLVLAVFSVRVSNAQPDSGTRKAKDMVLEDGPLAKGDSLKTLKLVLIREKTVDTLRIKAIKFGRAMQDSLWQAGDGTDQIKTIKVIGVEDPAQHGRDKMPVVVVSKMPPGYAIEWAKEIIRNPPYVVYYVNGVETSRESIKNLDPAKVTDVSKWKGNDAVAEHGEKCRNGLIEITTK